MGIGFVIKNGPKLDHTMQLSIYKWLAPHKIKEAQIAYFGMGGFVITGQKNTTTTWLKNKPSVSEKTHVCEVLETGKVRYDKKREFIVTYDTPAVKLLSKKKVEEFMMPKAIMLNEAFKNGVIPCMCDMETRRWKCDSYCSMKDRCDAIEKERNDKSII